MIKWINSDLPQVILEFARNLQKEKSPIHTTILK